jgi:uncharacterized protein with FMN-binding domain
MLVVQVVEVQLRDVQLTSGSTITSRSAINSLRARKEVESQVKIEEVAEVMPSP